MAQIVYTGTAGDDLLDASGLGTADLAVFRAAGGSDTLIGSSGNDRFDGGTGADSMFGGAGNDQFFLSLDNVPGGARDSIDGGLGTDQLIITMNGDQLTAANKAEVLRLNDFLNTHDTSAHFVSDVLHLDVTGVETAILKLDGVNKALGDIFAAPVTGADSYGATEDTALAVDATHGVLANDSSPAGGLTAVAGVLTTALGGIVTLAANGSFTYAPAANANGADSFTYSVTDSVGHTGIGSAAIQVAAVNDAAGISGTHAAAIDAYGVLSASGHLAVTDVDAGQAVFQAPTTADLHTAHGTFDFDATTGNWDYAVGAGTAQSVGFGQVVTDTLHVVSADGTAGQDIAVSIHGGGTVDYAVNGSFESPHIDTYYGAVQYPGSIDGWTTTGNGFEVWQNANGVTASNGSQHIELDNDGALDAITQTFNFTAGHSYVIDVDAQARTGDGLTNAFNVVWNGVTAGLVNPDYGVWHTYQFVVTAQAGANHLTLAELPAYNDSFGPLIDNVRVHDALWA